MKGVPELPKPVWEPPRMWGQRPLLTKVSTPLWLCTCWWEGRGETLTRRLQGKAAPLPTGVRLWGPCGRNFLEGQRLPRWQLMEEGRCL